MPVCVLLGLASSQGSPGPHARIATLQGVRHALTTAYPCCRFRSSVAAGLLAFWAGRGWRCPRGKYSGGKCDRDLENAPAVQPCQKAVRRRSAPRREVALAGFNNPAILSPYPAPSLPPSAISCASCGTHVPVYPTEAMLPRMVQSVRQRLVGRKRI